LRDWFMAARPGGLAPGGCQLMVGAKHPNVLK
jgi:hypothetical protein